MRPWSWSNLWLREKSIKSIAYFDYLALYKKLCNRSPNFYFWRTTLIRDGSTNNFQRPVTQALELIFKFEAGLYKSGLKTQHLSRCQHNFGAISHFLLLISAIKLYLETPDGQTCIQASTPIVVC